MDSFDFWDTLVARRTMRDEIHWRTRAGESFEDAAKFEFNNLIPIAENVAKVGYDMIVSDYGDGSEKWHHFVAQATQQVCKLPISGHNIIVTPGGKHEGTVWKTLPVQPDTHTGDNQHADVVAPGAAGIRGVLSVLSPYSEAEKYLNDKGLKQLALLCREARLRTFGKYRGIELLQVDYNFPVLFLASVVLNRMFPTQTLLMSGRDCYMWQKLMQRLYGRGVYWQSSVIARTTADENYHNYIESRGPNPLLVDISGSGKSFAALSEGHGYDSILLYRPLRDVESGIKAMVSSEDCFRLEQANVAPHEKCIGVDAMLKPIFSNKSGINFGDHSETWAQVNAFKQCLDILPLHDLTYELQLDTATCIEVMSHLLHKYIQFAAAVEPLRQLAVKDDQ